MRCNVALISRHRTGSSVLVHKWKAFTFAERLDRRETHVVASYCGGARNVIGSEVHSAPPQNIRASSAQIRGANKEQNTPTFSVFATILLVPPATKLKTLDRVLSKAGIASRADARRWIAAGRVAVNGKVILNPDHWVSPAPDGITLDGKPL